MRKIFVALLALFFFIGVTANNALAVKGVKYKEGSVSGGGSIEGKVLFKGDKPPHAEIVKEKNPEVCGTGVRIIDPWTLGSGGELLDAVVYIQDIKTGKKWPAPNYKFDQKTCAFSPYISVMRNKKKVEVVNLDPIGHNIHTYEYIGKIALSKLKPGGINMTVLNVGQPDQGFTFKKKIKLRRDNQMKMECDIHNFMHGWMLALENPYYDMTKADGTFKIDNVPAGTYKVIAWHPTFGTHEQKVTVSGGASQSATFELQM
jgi:hypothetical protein